MRRGIWDCIRDQFTPQPPVVKADLTGKTVLVLGANTGLGFEAAQHFATMNPGLLILACRSQSRGQAALERLKVNTGCTTAEVWIVDLADFASVKQFGDKFERDGRRLDILVLNAAVLADKYEPSKDGRETALQISCLSTPLVALILLPTMLKTAREHATHPRIVYVSSEMHYWASIPKHVIEDPEILKTLGSKEYCTTAVMATRYHVTKLLSILFVRALTARLPPDSPLIVTAVNPGFCHSDLTRGLSGIVSVLEKLFALIFSFSTEVGSRQFVFAALALEDSEELRGSYISGSKIVEPSDFVMSAEGKKIQDRIWDETVEILEKVDPRVGVAIENYLSEAVVD
ncbi:hypothetical protein C8F04DRAFT_1127180 [Mycena alexandri]|uniref:Uncharacterized protein n=1 Tax=Mycena alexandri TaxID=1745969 RepID=A0AAD6SDT7_9AGAR|nr:hypothetical protein C8F04DRAFT_1127180 [Mycena alexandri]